MIFTVYFNIDSPIKQHMLITIVAYIMSIHVNSMALRCSLPSADADDRLINRDKDSPRLKNDVKFFIIIMLIDYFYPKPDSFESLIVIKDEKLSGSRQNSHHDPCTFVD